MRRPKMRLFALQRITPCFVAMHYNLYSVGVSVSVLTPDANPVIRHMYCRDAPEYLSWISSNG
jgi:hypothetical protein